VTERTEWGDSSNLDSKKMLAFMADKLRRDSGSLNTLGLVVMLITAAHLFVVILHLLGLGFSSFERSILLFTSATLVFLALTFTLLRDILSKRSQALFDEATSLLQMVVDKSSSRERDFLYLSKIREAARFYSVSTDYPLVPGKNGGAILVLTNLVLFFFAAGVLFRLDRFF
jgi:hypothetical protein